MPEANDKHLGAVKQNDQAYVEFALLEPKNNYLTYGTL